MTARFARGERFWTVAIVVLACLLRAAAFLAWPENIQQDRDGYLALARQVAAGRGYSNPATGMPTAFRPPLYPLLLAGLFQCDGYAAIGVAQVVAGAVTVWLTIRIGRSLEMGAGGLIAGALVAADPLLVQHATLPMTETLCALLATMLIWSLIPAGPELKTASEKPAGQLFVGVLFGLCALTRPTFWAFGALAALVWMSDCLKRGRSKADQRSSDPTASPSTSQRNSPMFRHVPIWIVVGACATVAPWVIRNLVFFHRPIVTTTHGGYTLLLGNNPVFYQQEIQQPWGTVWEDAPPEASQAAWYERLQTEWRAELGAEAGEVEIDRWMARRAYRHIRENSVVFLQACLHRLVRFWGFAPAHPKIMKQTMRGMLWRTVRTCYAFVFAGFVYGLWCIWRSTSRRAWSPSLVLIASFTLVHVVYWSNMRMRAPIVPLIALVSAVGWQVLWRWFRRAIKGKNQRMFTDNKP